MNKTNIIISIISLVLSLILIIGVVSFISDSKLLSSINIVDLNDGKIAITKQINVATYDSSGKYLGIRKYSSDNLYYEPGSPFILSITDRDIPYGYSYCDSDYKISDVATENKTYRFTFYKVEAEYEILEHYIDGSSAEVTIVNSSLPDSRCIRILNNSSEPVTSIELFFAADLAGMGVSEIIGSYVINYYSIAPGESLVLFPSSGKILGNKIVDGFTDDYLTCTYDQMFRDTIVQIYESAGSN